MSRHDIIEFEKAELVEKGRKRSRGRRAYLSGVAAEEAVCRAYDALGADVLDLRWRGKGGEIDMILQQGPDLIICEVKKARSFDEAAERLLPDQMRRIHAAAAEYIGNMPLGQLTALRFDLALVDERGAVEIREAAFSHF